jgi:nucleotide-binding universal stress UspA family protein
MAIKDLLIYVDARADSKTSVDYALGLVELEGAHVIGVSHAPTGDATLRESAVEALSSFARTGEQRGVSVETRLIECAASKLPDEITLQARHADMSVLGQPATDGPLAKPQMAVFEELLFYSGRPVLVVPWAGKADPVPQTAIVAWDASGTAARAVADALPLLKRAKKVIVLVAADRNAGEHPGTDIALHLARHGVTVETRYIPMDAETETADLLLSQSAELGAGLMVMGGYHHSRIRESILGGVTRTIMRTMTLPVLLSH